MNNDTKKHQELKPIQPAIIGVNYLHRHEITEKELGLDKNHVIVDKTDMESIVKFLKKNPDVVKKLNNFRLGR